MEADEDDYMSDKFITAAICSAESKRVRKRKQPVHSEHRKKQNKTTDGPLKSLKKQLEYEARDKGLCTPITEDNKGFSMLQKMGYKPGMGLGKEGRGRIAPVSVELKEGKKGLGREMYVKEVAELKMVNEIKTVSTYKQNKQVQFDAMRTRKDLWKSQLSCQQMDTLKGVVEPLRNWFWPKAAEEEEVVDVDTATTIGDQLIVLTEYLRKEHQYCVWCGTVFNGEEDLNNSCPGNSAEDHD